MKVGYVMGLKKEVVWVLSKLVDYEKSHKWPKVVIWFSNPSKQVYGSILSDYGTKSIEKCVSLITIWFLSVLQK